MSVSFLEHLRSQHTFKSLCALHPDGEGNSLEHTDDGTATAQIAFFCYLIMNIQPQKILETGTNKGLFAYLLSNIVTEPVTLYTFGIQPQSKACVDFLNGAQQMVGIQFYLGDSKQTMAAFFENDIQLAWVDGGHDEETAYSDIKHCIRLNIPFIAIDDLNNPALQKVLARILEEHAEYQVSENPFSERDSRRTTLISKKGLGL